MTRRSIAFAAVIAAVLAVGGIVWWATRGDDGGAPAGHDPWAGKDDSADRALLEQKRKARGNAPADTTPASASGRVLRAADGSGVAGAVVSVVQRAFGGDIFPAAGGGDRTIVVITDATGAWTATAIPPGPYVVTAAADGFLPGSIDLDLAAGARRDGVDVKLAAGGTLVSGTVSDIGGGPIAEAHVTVRPDGMRALDTSAAYVAITGADGTYRMTLPDGRWKGSATQSEYSDAEHDFELRGKPVVVDFELTPGGVIRGVVVDRATDKPVPGAMVAASAGIGGRERDWGAGNWATADDTGAFVLRGLGSGAIQLVATARGFASAGPTIVELGIAEEASDVRVVVDKAYTVSGFVVTNDASRDGIAGVRVGVFSMAKETGAFALQPTGADGYFEIIGVQPASYITVAIGEDVMPDFGKNVTVVDRDVTDVLIAIDRGTTLAGRVDPATVARLSLEIDSSKISFGNMFDIAKAAMVRGASAADGAFELRHVPEGSYSIVARAADGRTGKLPVTVGATDQMGLVVKLEPRASIAGRVVDERRRPVPGVQVRVSSSEPRTGFTVDSMDEDHGITAADGSFEIVGITPGEIEINVRDDHDNLKWAGDEPDEPKKMTVAASDAIKNLVLEVESRDGVIRGVVIGLDGKPVADAWVTAQARHDWMVQESVDGGTDEVDAPNPEAEEDDDVRFGTSGVRTVLTRQDGRFALADLRRGSYTVVAETTKSGARARKRAKTGDTITLTLEKLGSLGGVVTLGGRPVTDYDIECNGPAGKQRRHVAAADGAYSIDRLPRGKYTCTATAADGAVSGETRVEGQTAKLDLALGAWASVTGVVVDKTGKPMPGLKVAAAGGEGMSDAMTQILTGGGPTTDASGRFEVGKLPPGDVTVMVFDSEAAGFQPLVTKHVTTTAGQRLDLGTLPAGDEPEIPAPAQPAP